ncbi:MAG: 1-deoxy-D-xylulose-5-phosphate synthase, partial [Candidatus Margulisbacteria bacterium]|nr:1-deoxy-D-xylulose-5-phosphate synthase [Candidatus Margulisiibacteriota bacterium]
TNNRKKSMLDTLKLPEEISTLSISELELLAKNIRQKLFEICDECGGHLASNLGAVELTIALHSILDSPTDKIVWDVSHQTYVHKMLTGRLHQMNTNRKKGGLSGFAKISESEHDAFGAGHASTALSAALGIAHARDLNEETYSVFSVIGDASLSGGMAFEALNNIEKLKTNFVCILNDNDMSISPPVGSIAAYMTRLRTSWPYTKAKNKFERVINRIPKIGVPLMRKIEKTVERMRDIVIDFKFGVIFEEFGFKYLGPIDGHNIPQLTAAFKFAKDYHGPIMIHILTVKGKGLQKAEKDPVKFHGVSPKTKPTSMVQKGAEIKPLTYTQVFGSEIISIAEKNPKIMVITPAMREGSGLVEYEKKFPHRFFDVGIAEEHAVTFSAGLARAGAKPVLAIYSTFLQRGFDQLIHDICIQKLPVVFALDRAGLVGEDGATHHGVFDYSFLLPIPNLTVLAPKDGAELRHMLNWAINQTKAVSIRYPKGPIPEREDTTQKPYTDFVPAECLFSSPSDSYDVCLIGAGSMSWPAYTVAKQLHDKGIKVAAINLRCIKPLDVAFINSYIQKSTHVFILEEGNPIGGVFSHVLHSISV